MNCALPIPAMLRPAAFASLFFSAATNDDIFGPKGLRADLGIQGSRITRLKD